MARNGDLRKLLEKKLNVKQAQLYRIAQEVANSLSISTGDAMLVLAAKNQINLHKHGGNLPAGKLDQIRGLLPYLPATAQATAAPTVPSGRNGRRGAARPKRVFKVKLEKPENDPIVDRATLAEMEAMVPVYQTLYQLENSIRQFIARVLKAKHGKDWWDKKAPQTPKEQVAKRMKDDQINAWHQKRSANPIDYLDLNQLPALVRAAQSDFVDAFFPSTEWFQQFIDEVYRSRCVVCHMNPLTQNNVDGVGLRFNQWEELVKVKADDLKKLENSASTAPAAIPVG
jgi:Swt1-like HEPN